jgi:hypothetical protein
MPQDYTKRDILVVYILKVILKIKNNQVVEIGIHIIMDFVLL